MKTSDYDYALPAEAIAQVPSQPRESCKLVVLDRATGRVEHTVFAEIGRFLKAPDCLVLNNSKVMAARVSCRKESGTAQVEVLLLHRSPNDPWLWEALLKPARRVGPGARLVLQGPVAAGFALLEKTAQGTAWLKWLGPAPLDQATLDSIGQPP